VTREDAPAPDRGADAKDAHAGERLRDVVRRLLTPARAGFFLARDDLGRVGSALGYPLPALDRRIMLEQLFLAAGPAGIAVMGSIMRALEPTREVKALLAIVAAAYPRPR